MYKIIELKINNVKNVKAIDITPNDVNVIAGKNGAGKSSVLDAIAWGIAGKKGLEDTPLLIRNGENKASVQIVLDDIIIRRTATESGERLEVLDKDGNKQAAPQKILDKLFTTISFDPIKFKDMKPSEQIKILFDSVSPDVTFEELESMKKSYYDERTSLNRDVKKFELAIGDTVYTEDELNMPIPSAGDLIARISESQEIARQNAEIENKYRIVADKYKSVKAQIEALQIQLEELKTEGRKLKEQCESLPNPEPIEPLKEDLSKIEQLQNTYRKIQDYKNNIANLETAKKESANCTSKINEIEQKKLSILEAAKLPIKGLTFGDEGLYYKGVPFTQCCTSDKLMISTVISCVLNPKLNVILIRDGSLLDDDNFNQIQKIAKYYDVQVWIEKVVNDLTGTEGIVIENGEVKNV
ncbi:MAG TPA: AAA family ATPase [Melioribacteraceae bacterium]|nr:AAA family ATPase [Melioribacteraceae bacterium]